MENFNSIRKENPLNYFSSYTYNFSLYVATPEVLNDYMSTGTLIRGGRSQYVVVAQSGGVNSASEPRGLTYSGRPGPGEEGPDFFIDDVNITQTMVGTNGQKTATVGSELNFKIIEPTGFTFLNRLSTASDQINRISGLISASKGVEPNLAQQYYILGVRFYGYDDAGNIVEDSSNTSLSGSSAYYERFFPLIIRSITFKLTGKATEYAVEAVILPEQVGFGTKHGRLKAQIEISGDNVDQLLSEKYKSGLLAVINEQQEKYKSQDKVATPIQYAIKWLDENSRIANAKVVKENLNQLSSAPMTNVATTTGVTPKVSTSSSANTVNVNGKKISYKAGWSIPAIMDQIIANSSYITDRLKEFNNNQIAVGVDSQTGIKKDLIWFSISPIVEITGRDPTTNDWSYKITYEIGEYKVPYFRTPYKTQKSKYYGPYKEYNYWFTGKNSDVISYEQTYNNLFYSVIPGSTTSDTAPKEDRSTTLPIQPGSSQYISSAAPNRSTNINDTVRATLYSIADQNQVVLKIMGDPDYLMSIVGTTRKYEAVTNPPGYGRDFTINPYDGEIFIEIIFQMGEDYSMDDGLLDVTDGNSLILFGTKEQKKLIGANGVVYRVISVVSSFSRGVFTQVLNLILVPPEELLPRKLAPVDQSNRATTAPVAPAGTRIPPSPGASEPPYTRPVTPSGTSSTDFDYWRKEIQREERTLRGRNPERKKPIITTTGLDPNTLLPLQQPGPPPPPTLPRPGMPPFPTPDPSGMGRGRN